MSCASPVPPQLPDPPSLSEPKLAVPADLDLVIRIDLEALRSTLGEALPAAFESVLRTTPEAAHDATTKRLLLALLARSKTAWVGVRPGLAPELTDNVLVLRGQYDKVLPRDLGGEPAWGRPRDLGGGVLRFERAEPRLRAYPAVLYFRAPDLAVFGSYAEVDALERSLESGRADAPLEPPDTGTVSVAARLTELAADLRRRAPTLAKFVDGAETFRASAGLGVANLDVRADIRFESPERARTAAEALGAVARLLGSGPDKAWLAQAEVTAVERFVTIRCAVPQAELARALGRLSAAAEPAGGTVSAP